MKKIAIFGLGNPGEKYTNNRHNVGFLFLDTLANQDNWKTDTKLEAEICELVIADTKVILAKPTTFMNNSGRAISKVMNYFDIPKEDILVIHDDLDLPFGSIRFSKDSGPAGHNGIKSIIEYLGTQEFTRLRIGIANEIYTEQNIPSEKFVLENFNKEELGFIDSEKKELPRLSEKISDAVLFYIENGFDKTKDEYNKSAMPLIVLR